MEIAICWKRPFRISKDNSVETVQSNLFHLFNAANKQVAMIVTPTENLYSGILCYSAVCTRVRISWTKS
jgi:hypothetical protein